MKKEKIRFKVRATGERSKFIPVGNKMTYKNLKDGKVYGIEELEYTPKKHIVTAGFNVYRCRIEGYARTFANIGLLDFGISASKGETFVDIELKFACFGVGLHFIYW